MNNELIIKRCNNCLAMVKVLVDCKCDNCPMVCCNEDMVTLKANTFDAAVEKHKPVYEIENNKLVVTVNHVMEDVHYIEWITYIANGKEQTISFKPNEEAKVVFNYLGNGIVYSYCNKHDLWSSEVN